MSKQLFVDPVELRKSGKIKFEDIPVNQYNKTIEDEKKNYTKEEAKTVLNELIDDLCLRMRNEKRVTAVVALMVGYANSQSASFNRQMSLLAPTDDTETIKSAIFDLYKQNIEDLPIRHLYISFGKLSSAKDYQQLNLFVDAKEMEDRKNLQLMMDAIHNKYGQNMVVKASALTKESTAIERHNMIGGHKK